MLTLHALLLIALSIYAPRRPFFLALPLLARYLTKHLPTMQLDANHIYPASLVSFI